jgi:cytoplasmic tRNA 2-thiolation protein 1
MRTGETFKCISVINFINFFIFNHRGYARAFLKDLEKVRPSVIMDIIHSGETLQFQGNIKKPQRGVCDLCGFVSSCQPCKACVLLEGLNRGLPKLGIGKKSKADKMRIQQDLEKAHMVKNDF